MIDLDPQGNASTALDVDHHVGVPSVYDVLVDERPLAEVVPPAGTCPACSARPPPSTWPAPRSSSSRWWRESAG